jgi:hydroxymethylpyrimidine/phosphomethylpyrimidine kinase
MPKAKALLSLAGYDPSGGAGLILDLAVFERLGYHGAGVVTALTVQDTRRVLAVRGLSSDFLEKQYRALRRDLSWCGIKVGMIGTAENLRSIGRILAENAGVPRVIDPVLKSSSGAWLLEPKAVRSLLPSIKGRAALLTPNTEEAALLSGRPVHSLENMRLAADDIFARTGVPCLIKGGHLTGPATDLLFDGRRFRVFRHRRRTADVHGTGCFLSAAVLVYLADGNSLGQACGRAITLTARAIRGSRPVGHGRRVICFPG